MVVSDLLRWNFISQRIGLGEAITNSCKATVLLSSGVRHVLDLASSPAKKENLPWTHGEELTWRPLEGQEHLQVIVPEIVVGKFDYFWLGPPASYPPPTQWFMQGVYWAMDVLAWPGSRVYVNCVDGLALAPSIVFAILLAWGIPYNLAAEMIFKSRRGASLEYAPQALEAVKNLFYLSQSEGFLAEWG